MNKQRIGKVIPSWENTYTKARREVKHVWGSHTFPVVEKGSKRCRMEAYCVQLWGCATEFEFCLPASAGNHWTSHQEKWHYQKEKNLSHKTNLNSVIRSAIFRVICTSMLPKHSESQLVTCFVSDRKDWRRVPRMGDTCTPTDDSCQYMAKKKPLQYCKVISLQLIKINLKKIFRVYMWINKTFFQVMMMLYILSCLFLFLIL